MTGITRSSSVASGTGFAPGLVDSPPTSMMSAPAFAILFPSAIASAGLRFFPPSENESGVTLRMPIIRGLAPTASFPPRTGILTVRGSEKLRTDDSISSATFARPNGCPLSFAHSRLSCDSVAKTATFSSCCVPAIAPHGTAASAPQASASCFRMLALRASKPSRRSTRNTAFGAMISQPLGSTPRRFMSALASRRSFTSLTCAIGGASANAYKWKSEGTALRLQALIGGMPPQPRSSLGEILGVLVRLLLPTQGG